MLNNSFRKYIFLLGIIFSVVFSVSTVYAKNPLALLSPTSNILDPGASNTPWGGCGPFDANCYTARKIAEPKTKETFIGILNKAPTQIAVSETVSQKALLSALRNLLADDLSTDLLAKLRGPAGPAGPKGDPGLTATSASVTYIPAGIIPPNPVNNYAGGSLFSATDLSSTNFITKDAKIVTLAVSGNTNFTGDLNIGGNFSSVGNNTLGSGASSVNTIGSSTTPGALTLHGATTLDNTFSQTGANTFSTGTGAISLNGPVTITGANTFATGTGTVTLNNATTNISSTSPVIDLTTATTLSINTVTNRPITTGTGLVTLGGSLTVTGTAWTATPTISGLITATSGLTSNGTLTVQNNSNLTMSSGTGVFAQTYAPTTDATADAHTVTLSAGGTGQTGTLRGLVISQADTATTGAFDTLLYLENLKNPEITANGLFINNNAATGTLTNAINITNTAGTLTTGISMTGTFGNYISAPNFSVSNAGAVVAVGVNAGTGAITTSGNISTTGSGTITSAGLLTSSLGLTASGAAINLNVGSNFATNINTGTSSGTVTIGGGSAPLVIDSTNFDVSSAGALSGITTIATSSTINSQTISATASFTGTVQAATSFLAPTWDTATGVAMNIGTATQTALTLGRVGATTAISGSTITAGSATTTAISLGNVTSNPTLTLLGTGLTTLGGSLTVTGTAWTATPTISGLITATSGLTSNGTLTVQNNSNLTMTSGTGVFSQTYTGTGDAHTITSSATGASNKTLNVAQTGATTGTDYAGYFSNTGAATTNVGLYATATGATNNYAAIFEEGNVGIGLVSPTANLQVAQGTAGVGTVSTTATLTTVTGVGTQFLNTFKVGDTITVNAETRTIATIVSNTSLTTDAWTGSNAGVAYTLVGGTRFSVLGNGNVGIGNTAPLSKLGITGNASIGATYGAIVAPTSGMIIEGNVGIGTTAPGQKLDVAGNINIRNSDAYNIQGGGVTYDWNRIGSYGATPFYIQTNNTARVYLDATGNVGIGTTGPATLLQLGNTSYTFAASGLSFGDGDTGFYESADDVLKVNIAGNTRYSIDTGYIYGAGVNGFGISNANVSSTTPVFLPKYGDTDTGIGWAGADILSLIAGGTNVMNITNGNVGIGTTNPGSILALGGTVARIFGMDRNTTAATAGQGFTISSGGAIAGTADLAGGDLTLKSGISTGLGTSALRFFTATAGVTGIVDNAPTEKMTILGNGNVGIGNTAPGQKLDVTGTIRQSGCTTAGTLSANVSGDIICTPSSIRFKHNIIPLTFSDGLAIVKALTPVSFVFNSDMSMGSATQVGFIAEEANLVDPRLVTINEKTNQIGGFRYENYTAVLTKAIQELDLKITNLEKGKIVSPTTTLGQYASAFFSDVVTKVENGVAYMKALVVDALKIGSPTKRTGITFYDEVTGEPYCLSVANGVTKTVAGECVVVESTPPSTPLLNQGEEGTPPSSEGGAGGGDLTPPVITLNGEATINLIVGDAYTEAGAKATDDVDTEIAIIISGAVDTSVAGTYTITYSATDTAGNSAIPVTRTVNVGTPTPTDLAP